MTISFIIEHSAITGRKTSSKSSKREKERLLQNPARERERERRIQNPARERDEISGGKREERAAMMQGMMKGNAGSSSSCSSVSRGGGGGGGGGGSPCGSLRGRRSVMGERGRRTAAMLQRKRVNVTRRAATRKEGFDGAVGKEGGGGVGAEEEEEMAMPLQGQQEEQNTKRESKRTSVASVETAAVNEVFQTGTRMAPGTCIRYSNQASSLLFPSECRVCVCVCVYLRLPRGICILHALLNAQHMCTCTCERECKHKCGTLQSHIPRRVMEV